MILSYISSAVTIFALLFIGYIFGYTINRYDDENPHSIFNYDNAFSHGYDLGYKDGLEDKSINK